MMSMSTPEQRAAYMRDWYERNPDKYQEQLARGRAWKAANKERHLAGVKAWSAAHPRQYDPERSHRWKLAERGLTKEEYDTLLARQGGVCFFCGRPETADRKKAAVRRLSVDHDHETNQIRGLLCLGCNISLGCFERGLKSRLDPVRVNLYLSGAWI